MTNAHADRATADQAYEPWRSEVVAKVALLHARADSACAAAGGDERIKGVCARVQHLLEATASDTLAKRGRLRWLRDWRNGGPIERAWRNLHSAEILLAEVVELGVLASERPAVRSMSTRVLPARDARAVAVEKRLTDALWDRVGEVGRSAAGERLRREYVAALTWVNDACDKNFTRVRNFRNIVLATTAGLVVVVLGLGLLGALSPRSLPVCFDAGTLTADDVRGQGSPTNEIVCPTGAERGPTGGDVPLLLVVGLAAGAFAAALAVRGMRGTSTPYGVPVAIAWLKLPAGALTALLGTLLLRGGFVPGLSALDTQGQIIAYAIVFGYAQQVFTRMVDNQAQAVLNRSPSSEPSPAGVSTLSGGAQPGAGLAGAETA